MITPHDLFLAAVAFISEILGVLSGFGSSTFFLPAASRFESLQFVLALTALLHCFSNTSKIFLFRHDLTFSLAIKFMLPSVIFCGLGALLNPYLSTKLIEVALGLFLMGFALAELFIKKKSVRVPRTLAVPLSAASGFLTGFIGTGGALRGVALSSLNVSKHSFVALSSAIDFGGDFLRAGIYLKNGYMDWSQWFYLPLLAIAAYAGVRVGRKILGHFDQAQFEKTVSVFIFISGLSMVL